LTIFDHCRVGDSFRCICWQIWRKLSINFISFAIIAWDLNRTACRLYKKKKLVAFSTKHYCEKQARAKRGIRSRLQ
jgi:hypothetical protein